MKASDQMDICHTSTFAIQPMKEFSDESFPASQKGMSVCIGPLSVVDLNHSNTEKGKAAQAPSEATSRKSEDSHDSVESCNSKRLVLIGKRARNHDSEISMENQRSKKKTYAGSSSGLSSRQSGSFMNWVATITHGFSRFNEATPLAFVPPLSRHDEGNLDVKCSDMGFKSIFQSLYSPRFSVNNTDADVVKELKFDSERSHGEVSTSQALFHNRSLQVGDSHSIENTTLFENTKCDVGTVGSPVDVTESSSKPASNIKSKPHRNLWITRFSPKVSPVMPNTEQNIRGMDNRAPHGSNKMQHNEAVLMDDRSIECLKKGKQKLESDSNPVLPSHKFRKIEALASTSGYRSDMHRYHELSKVTATTATTCFLCGKSHHGIGKCS